MEPIEPTSGTPALAEPIASTASIAVQVAAYAGAAMGLVGTFALIATSAEPSDTTLLLVAVAVTAVLFAAGLAIGDDGVSSNQRLRGVLWFAALLGWVVVIEGFLIVAGIDLEGRARQLLSAGLAAVAAVGLWVMLRRSLQLIGMFVALLAVVSAAVFPEPDPFGRPDLVATALVTWIVGGVWMALGARGIVRPARTAVVLGTVTVLVAPFTLASSGAPSETTLTVVELWVLGSAVAGLVVGSWLGDRAVEGLAIVGVLLGVAVLVADLVADSQGGSIAAVVAGILLLAGAVLAIRAARSPGSPRLAAAGLPEPPPPA